MRERMKAFKLKSCLIAVVAALAAALFALCFFSADTVHASSHSDGDNASYAYVINSFNAVYDIGEDGYMEVTEILDVTYTGAKSYAVTRTLASESDERVRNVNVYERQSDGTYAETTYSIDGESSVVELVIGDEDSKTGENIVYKITYGFFCNAQKTQTLILYPLRGIEAEITEAEIALNLPYSPTDGTYITLDGKDVTYTADGTTVTIIFEDAAEGASLDVHLVFVEGYIGGYADYTGYFVLIVLAVIAAALITVKFVFFNKNKLKKEIMREPPCGYDPLIVGKLVDNSVSDADVASLIFHWAAKGYIKFNLKNPERPIIIKQCELPAISPDYQQIMYFNLFRKSDIVYIDELDDDFYKTTESVKKIVDKKASGSYLNTSMGLSVLFAVLAAFVIGLTPTIFAVFRISGEYVYITGLIFALPPLIIYGFMETLMYNRYKLKGKEFARYMAAIIAAGIACTALYAWAVPSNIIELWPKILISVIGYALCILSTILITRTEKYNRQLGAILGFRKFIKMSEHVELREASTQDPMFFFEIYPYAQVLNLEKEWTDKFPSMNTRAPDWNLNWLYSGKLTPTTINDIKTARLRITAAISSSPKVAKKRKQESKKTGAM